MKTATEMNQRLQEQQVLNNERRELLCFGMARDWRAFIEAELDQAHKSEKPRSSLMASSYACTTYKNLRNEFGMGAVREAAGVIIEEYRKKGFLVTFLDADCEVTIRIAWANGDIQKPS